MAKKKTQLDRIIDTFLDEMFALDVKRSHLAETITTLRAQRDAKPPRKPKALTVKPPKPGELRDRAILGGEPSL